MVKDKEIEKLQHLFLERLSFGTAGLRARMGPGFTCMNEVTIIQTGQGLVRYLQTCTPDLSEKGIVIGYDGRYNSKRYLYQFYVAFSFEAKSSNGIGFFFINTNDFNSHVFQIC